MPHPASYFSLEIRKERNNFNRPTNATSVAVYQISTLVSYGACREIRHVMTVGEEVGHLIGAPGGPPHTPQSAQRWQKWAKNGQVDHQLKNIAITKKIAT